MRDFTLAAYQLLLETLQSSNYMLGTFQQFVSNAELTEFVVLRHDVDRLPKLALEKAKLENRMGIKSTYYFRMIPSIFKPQIIRAIHDLGHEIGYHYEDLAMANGNRDQALKMFHNNLETLRTIVPVSTICMHGSPLSKYDNRDLLPYINFAENQILGEPYQEMNPEKWIYYTDSARRWDGDAFVVRDKTSSTRKQMARSTFDLIKIVSDRLDSPFLMITTHPERWCNNNIQWLKQLVLQSVKNRMKQLLIILKK